MRWGGVLKDKEGRLFKQIILKKAKRYETIELFDAVQAPSFG